MNAEAQITAVEPLALVVFGRDESGKAHGSAFTATDADLAFKAAELMGMRALPVHTDAEQALAAKLPRGRVFASGKAFVPFIKATLLTELQTAALNSGITPLKLVGGADAGDTSTSLGEAPADDAVAPVKQPGGWGNIRVGAIVLATAGPKYTEWYECLVLAVNAEDAFKLRYCDFPNELPFERPRNQLGLMHPAYVPAPPTEPTTPASPD
ncbi:hypothetical protein [Methylobacterium thuringiense]|uniref:Uncharacterized protein n=1 Tax=Methylobacterium thuringiense TaxID=1003091 RepID=A0ABQ4TEJ8_9HYPH|nr:hypothetical protein [Methylobacterium thuringiense]GJE53804.1 hypothetical protein EKPJFOCH_0272 [Methylobacterium thuringiense]